MSRKRIYKYTAWSTTGSAVVTVPAGARVLAAAMQEGQLRFWAEVDPDALRVERSFAILPTGGEVPDGFVWRATVQDPPFVWHLYERAPE